MNAKIGRALNETEMPDFCHVSNHSGGASERELRSCTEGAELYLPASIFFSRQDFSQKKHQVSWVRVIDQ